jgi:hypothetical protein
VATVASDLISGDTGINLSTGGFYVGQDSATALVTWELGTITPIGVVDFAIDAYASSYNSGYQPGVYEILGIEGEDLSDHLENIFRMEPGTIPPTIQFGQKQIPQ